MVALNPEELGTVTNRLCGAQAKIGSVLHMIEQGRDCQDIVAQLAAVRHALNRAGFALVATSLQQCLAQPGGADSTDAQSLEKLFLSLA